MKTIELFFWICAALVFYTYLGYGMILWIAVKVREAIAPRKAVAQAADPEVTLLIAAYNEQEIIAEKMANCRSLDYPADKLHIAWVTDGSTDQTVERLKGYESVQILHEARRGGKTAALNRALQQISTPIVLFTDANTMLNTEAVREIVRCFDDPQVGCVAGEKRVAAVGKAGAAATEGLYWKYESKLKELDDRLYSTVGAAGELFAVRRKLWHTMPEDTLLDDFVCSMLIAADGYRIAYCRRAYALETPSADMREERKRKQRIAAGGLQSVWRLRKLLNPLRYGVLWFQYVSHRVLRWSITPLALAALLPLNALLLTSPQTPLYTLLFAAQLLFYGAAAIGWMRERQGKHGGILTVPYYFIFMNINLFRGVAYLIRHRGRGTWEKAARA